MEHERHLNFREVEKEAETEMNYDNPVHTNL